MATTSNNNENETKVTKASAIDTAIRNTATNKLAGKYNLAQYKEGAKR